MLKITLDTNCFINLFDRDSATAQSVETIGDLMRQGLLRNVDVAVTTRVEADLGNDRNAMRRSEMLQYLNILPIIPTIFRIGMSATGRDSIADGTEARRAEELQRVLFPGLSTNDKRYSNKISDIDHLVGHLEARRDIFVTDDTGILKKRDELSRAFGLRVSTPQQCLAEVLSAGQGAEPVRSPAAALDIEISIERKNKLIESHRHEYELAILVKNKSAETLRDYHVDIQFPTKALLPGNVIVSAQSGGDRSVIRYLYNGDAEKIFPDDVKRFQPVRYFMNTALFWQHRDELFCQPVIATLYANGQRYRVEKRFEDLQNF